MAVNLGIGITLFMRAGTGVEYLIGKSRLDILKEVKQVQLQILELQASMQKDQKTP